LLFPHHHSNQAQHCDFLRTRHVRHGLRCFYNADECMFTGSNPNTYQEPELQFVRVKPRCHGYRGPHAIATPMVAHISTPEKEQAISELFVILALLGYGPIRAGVFYNINKAACHSQPRLYLTFSLRSQNEGTVSTGLAEISDICWGVTSNRTMRWLFP
jgi:hypothetical protein